MKLRQLVAVAALAPSAAWAADFSGTWRIDNLFNGASAIITCTLVQAGNALSGSCKPEIPGIAGVGAWPAPSTARARSGVTTSCSTATRRASTTWRSSRADGTLKGNVLRNGSPSPITAVKQ